MIEDTVLELMRKTLILLRDHHESLPRGKLTRHYAITITELEKTLAYYKTYISEA